MHNFKLMAGRAITDAMGPPHLLRPLADVWCRLSEGNLLRAGAAVRPLRAAAVARLALMGEDAPVDDDAGSAAGSLAPSSVSEP